MLPNLPEKYVKKQFKNENLVIMAKDHKHVLGGLVFRNHEMYIELVLMAVRNDIQFKGVGSRLIDYLKSIIPTHIGCIFVKSDLKCTKFYKKNGFTMYLTLPKKFLDKFIFKTDGSVSMECHRSDGGFLSYNKLKEKNSFLLNFMLSNRQLI